MLALLQKWRSYREDTARLRRYDSLSRDEAVIADQVPELAGKSDVEGMAFTLDQIGEWAKAATPGQSAELQRRLAASAASFEAEGIVMPYWGNLWVLRTYQRELGLDVPNVAPSAASKG